MPTVMGVVEQISSKNGINSVKVGENWYGFYKTKPKCEKGDTVSFEFEKKGDWLNADPKTLEVKKDVPKAAPPPAANNSYNSDARVQADKEKQLVISWQAARNSAIELIVAALDKEVIKLPAAQNKKFDALTKLVDDMTVKYYDESLAQKVKMVASDDATPRFADEE